jgi:hypothetical protein
MGDIELDSPKSVKSGKSMDSDDEKNELDKEIVGTFDPIPMARSPMWLRIVNVLLIIGLLVLMGVYTAKIVTQFYSDLDTPPTSTQFITGKSGMALLPLPRIVLCQMAPNIPLSVRGCFQFVKESTAGGVSCDATVTPITLSGEDVNDPEPLACIAINKDMTMSATGTGFMNSVDIEIDVNLDQYEPGSFAGVIVHFMPSYNGTEPTYLDVASSTVFAAPGVATVIGFRKRITKYYLKEEETFFDSNTNVVIFTPSTDGTPEDVGAAYISLCYVELAVEKITQEPAYQIQNLMGDFAGMLGTLVGIDAWSLIIWIEIFPRAVAVIARRRGM